ncbi:GntR family transcriptional regulator [Thalassococcus sp. S3]|uniref:GntR family transcriptional regulator n=1 Tax=Thalassococcus sp. S3 TaxID=2017482 RepID=UPI00102463BF|nr:GntR family transcriptional regulator [Thalassococcus sp. S3]QBF29723.1 GntR family transcriptional regulator [Thalassococcus sp. S3]
MQMMKIEAPGTPAHEVVYTRLRARILFGDLAPGEAVTIQGLATVLEAGMTPVREAIRRLISDGALTFQGNRRVSVPVLTRADVEELVFVRKTIESQLAHRAATRIADPIIAELTDIDTALDTAIRAGDVQGYLARNYDFHALLYAQADAPIMAGLADRLWLRFGPSLRVVCGRFGTESLPDRHKDMLAALSARDADAAATAMAYDVTQGMDQIAQMLSGPSDSIDSA